MTGGHAIATEKRAARVMMVDADLIVRMRKRLGVIRECGMRDEGRVGDENTRFILELLYYRRPLAREAS